MGKVGNRMKDVDVTQSYTAKDIQYRFDPLDCHTCRELGARAQPNIILHSGNDSLRLLHGSVADCRYTSITV